MNKTFKKVTMVAMALMALASMSAFAACDMIGLGNNSGENNNNPNEYVFEAEYTDLSMLQGSGWSGAPIGTACIVEDYTDLGASNNYWVDYLWAPGTKLAFEISAPEATTATLVLRMAISDEGTLSSSEYSVTVNGTAVDYSTVTFPNGGSPTTTPCKFADYTIGEVSLVAGTNVIELVTGTKAYSGDPNRNIAPSVDCIKLTSEAKLSWVPFEDNLG